MEQYATALTVQQVSFNYHIYSSLFIAAVKLLMLNALPRLWKNHAYIQLLRHPLSVKYPVVANRMNQILSILFSFLNIPTNLAVVLREEIQVEALQEFMLPCIHDDGGEQMQLHFDGTGIGQYLKCWTDLLQLFLDGENPQMYVPPEMYKTSFLLFQQAFSVLQDNLVHLEDLEINRGHVEKVFLFYFQF